ncbi:hypothetical protein ACIPSA_31560 [Streptomyces sp. NPDC086549]|uniref:hypothetical protein n=1 Tax=Streptomyces sp. NPDC086549 TaxID=3365752 RepID=UPI0038172BF3
MLVRELPPDRHTARRLAALPADGLPNGPAIDPSGRTLSVVDSLDDFSFLTSRSGVVLAAVNGRNQVDVVWPDGTRKTVLTAADGLASPTATARHGTTLYITVATSPWR